ncbi:hypothetical protein BU26DRAFT_561536 [Trematosphaeria pertusa]|uniref:Uncharacterized protein n=1 Tax=Trematosphaeria pertusa TaxID=390896 RepID=A0A6A6IMQ5_9PLEO|nr:uncharacterized protein BU26DRAFT_561536 [Trematosphaeria pertusa]KAF2251731.1 hypothetical protein BU26DRAFT_561536 [Trematosphaeria pertusa]
MRSLVALALGLLAAVAQAAPLAQKNQLDTVIGSYADVEGSHTLNTVISNYADAERRSLTTKDEPTPAEPEKVSPPVGTLDTIIHHYADVEGDVH